MDVSTEVIGLRDATDPHYLSMVEVVKVCAKANVPLPDGVAEYFGESDHGWSDATHILEDHLETPLKVRIPFHEPEFTNDGCDKFDVNVADIPSGVKTIRFQNCY